LLSFCLLVVGLPVGPVSLLVVALVGIFLLRALICLLGL
jgi:hypothetical protein